MLIALLAVLLANAPQPARSVPLTLIGDGHFGVTVTVAGAARPVFFAIDTGAGLDYVTPQLVSALKLAPVSAYRYQTFSGRTFTVELVAVPALHLANVALPDRQAMRFTGFDRSGVPPLLSASSFLGAPVTFDLRKQRLTFETPDTLARRAAITAAVPLKLQRDRNVSLLPMVSVEFGNGQHGECIVDTGSGGTMLNVRYMAPLGVKPGDPGVTSFIANEPAGKLQQYFAQIPELALRGAPSVRLAKPTVGFTEGAYDCQLGNDFWKDRAFTLDLPHARLYASRE